MLEAVKQYPFWDKLNKDEQEQVGMRSVIRHYDAGQLLHGNCDGGDSCLGLVYVLSGTIKAFVVSAEGREVTIFKLEGGECCVFAASCVLSKINQDTQMIATTDVELLVLPSGIFAELCLKNIEMKCFAYEMATEKYTEVMAVFEDILFNPLDLRLARFLVNKSREEGSREIKLTQEQIAQEINSAREVVARAMKNLTADHIVSVRRGAVIIEDLEKLKDMI